MVAGQDAPGPGTAFLKTLAAAALPVLLAGGCARTGGTHPASARLCGSQRSAVAQGLYTVQNNEWGSGAPECVTTSGGADFTVTSSSISKTAHGAPGGYPSIYRGCHAGSCTRDSGLPLQVAELAPGTVTTSWATAQPGNGAYNVAYDIWFNRTPATSGLADGAELMVWLSRSGDVRPYGSQVAATTVGGRSYEVWFGRQPRNTVTYLMTTPATSVTGLDVGQLAADAVSRGYIQASWYLISVEAGFELWQGGAGLATRAFTVSVHGP